MERVLADTGHMIVSARSIELFRNFTQLIGLNVSTFFFSATRTIFYSPAKILSDLINKLPESFWTENLVALGANRFFFEAPFPSLLVMLGAKPVFVGGAKLNENVNPCACYDFDPIHNSAVVLDQYEKWLTEGVNYVQPPVPYVFGSSDDVFKLRISFQQ